MKAHAAIAALAIALFGALASWFYLARPDATARPQVHRWIEALSVSEAGAREAYLTEGRSLAYEQAHVLAHDFGEALFASLGLDGIRLCTSDFSYGCYHAVAGEAFASAGTGIAVQLKAACDVAGEHSFECVHGTGHGALAYAGERRIADAFAICEPFNAGLSEVGGCFGGVMMEYNFRTMQSESGIDVRPFDTARPEGPCPELEEKFRPACYYELPAWWRASLPGAGELEYDWTEVGRLCSDTPAPYRAYCYRGIGNVVAPQSGYDTRTIVASCSRLSAEGSEACLGEALGHLLSAEGGPARLRSYCARPDAFHAFCRTHGF